MAAIGDNPGAGYDEYRKGAIYVLLMNADGTAKSTQKLADGTGGGLSLEDGTFFGVSLAALGDLDGDGITDIAVGASYDDAGGSGRGAIHILFLNANGTAKRTHKIAHETGGGPTIANWDRFGSSVTSLGDLDGNGVTDIAVGADGDDTGGSGRGALYVLFLEPARLGGDYNVDGFVNSADYVVWRKAQGTLVPPSSGADGDGNGTIDENDYGVWRTNFAQTLSSGSASAAISAAAFDVLAPNGAQANAKPAVEAPVVDFGIAQIGNQLSTTSSFDSESGIGRKISVCFERNSTFVARLRDNAMLRWLRDYSDAPRNRIDHDLDGGPIKQNESQAPSNNLFDELDQGFALLGNSSRLLPPRR